MGIGYSGNGNGNGKCIAPLGWGLILNRARIAVLRCAHLSYLWFVLFEPKSHFSTEMVLGVFKSNDALSSEGVDTNPDHTLMSTPIHHNPNPGQDQVMRVQPGAQKANRERTESSRVVQRVQGGGTQGLGLSPELRGPRT